jgi:hypothetical protein
MGRFILDKARLAADGDPAARHFRKAGQNEQELPDSFGGGGQFGSLNGNFVHDRCEKADTNV